MKKLVICFLIFLIYSQNGLMSQPAPVVKTIDKKIYAHLMPWFETKESNGRWGIHWTMANRNPDNIVEGRREIASHYYPLTGPYHSGDRNLIQYQLLLMKLSGIDGVLIDWYGILDANDYPINLENSEALIAELESVGLDFGIVYEDRTAGAVYTNIDDQVAAVKADFAYLENNYFNQSNYININDKPLLLNFGPVSITSPDSWDEIFTIFEGETPIFMPLWWNSNKVGNNAGGEFAWVDANSLVTGLTDFYGIRSTEVDNIMGAAFPGFIDYYEEGGWGGIDFEIRHNGTEIFNTTLQKALDADVDYIQLVTWNDYGEGTMIEPTEEFGFNFLTLLQESLGVSYNLEELELVLKLYRLRIQHAGDLVVQSKLDDAFSKLANLEISKAKAILDEYAVQAAYPDETPHSIPGEFQAVHFDVGGPEIAYHDANSGNTGNGPRPDDYVDTESSGNYDFVTSTKEGEWLEYSVNVSETGDYIMHFMVSSDSASGAFHVEIDDLIITDTIVVEKTTTDTSFIDKTQLVQLNKGEHTMRLVIDSGGVNILNIKTEPLPVMANAGADQVLEAGTISAVLDGSASYHLNDLPIEYLWEQTEGPAITIDSTNSSVTTIQNLNTGEEYLFRLTVSDGKYSASDEVRVKVNAKQEAYPDGIPHSIPGIIEAWEYDLGGEGVAYHDTDEGNNGDGPRAEEDVDTEYEDNGNPNLGWTRMEEWLEYTVDVAESGHYDLTMRVASGATSGKFTIEFDGVNVTDTVFVGNTGGWDTYLEKKVVVALTAGEQVMRIVVGGPDFNLSTMDFQPATDVDNPSDKNSLIRFFPNPVQDEATIMLSGNTLHKIVIADLAGRELLKMEVEDKSSVRLNLAVLRKGVYVCKIISEQEIYSLKFIK